MVLEPKSPPDADVNWSEYRPDVFGTRLRANCKDHVLVECETEPSMTRFRSKNYVSLTFQTRLFGDDTLRRILVVPHGKLKTVDLKLRSSWEIWIVGKCGITLRLPPKTLQ